MRNVSSYYVQQRFKCDAFIILKSIYLHETDLRRSKQKMLTKLNVLSKYDHIKFELQELIRKNTNKIRKFNFLLIVIIITDNFDMSQKRNEIRINDKNAHFFAIIALINEDVNISTIRFLQFMY